MGKAEGAEEAVETRVLPVYAAGETEAPFTILNIGETLDRHTRWTPHSHPVHELLWNERGTTTAVVDERIWPVTPKVGLWIPAGTVHAAEARAGVRYRAAYFGYGALTPIAEAPVAVEITELLRLLLAHLDADGLSEDARARAEGVAMDLISPSDWDMSLRMPQNPLLVRIGEAVLRDPRDTGTLDSWADRSGVSTRTITRGFATETGLSYSRWTALARAQHALPLLTGGMEMEEIAFRCGYRSPSAFGVAFRRATGKTPGEFRLSRTAR